MAVEEAALALGADGEHPSVCPLDCPDTCSLTVTVAAGKVAKVRGSESNPLTAGVVCAKVARTDAIRPGVVCSLKGAWLKTSDNGQTISALAPGTHADLAHGACFNDARVEVAAA